MSESASPEKDACLEPLRAKIDVLDARLLDLLNQRAACSAEIGALKQKLGLPLFRPGREQALLNRLIAANPGPLRERHLRALYREIFSISRDLQRPPRVAYLGPEGTFSHIAGLEYFGEAGDLRPKPSFEDIFASVESRECDLGIVPLENSLNGTVGQCLDLFTIHEVHVLAEWISRIRLSLITREQSLADVKTVYSHPQPLGQCARWLHEHLPGVERVSMESTAAAAHRVARENSSAAIGHARLAERLDLRVLAADLEDSADNWTRFFAIGPDPGEADAADKSSIVFSVANLPGSLATVLGIFAGAGINISKLESRPQRGTRWNYIFFADLDCNINDQAHASSLEEIRRSCSSLKVLGAYMEGRHGRAV